MPAPDQLTPQLVQSYIWSWAPGHGPPQPPPRPRPVVVAEGVVAAAARAAAATQAAATAASASRRRALEELQGGGEIMRDAAGAAALPAAANTHTPDDVEPGSAAPAAPCVLMRSSDGRWELKPSCAPPGPGPTYVACRRASGERAGVGPWWWWGRARLSGGGSHERAPYDVRVYKY